MAGFAQSRLHILNEVEFLLIRIPFCPRKHETRAHTPVKCATRSQMNTWMNGEDF